MEVRTQKRHILFLYLVQTLQVGRQILVLPHEHRESLAGRDKGHGFEDALNLRHACRIHIRVEVLLDGVIVVREGGSFDTFLTRHGFLGLCV